MKEIFDGVGVALITPFYRNKVDYTSLQNLIESCLNDGASAIVVLATTGEGVTITQIERKAVIGFCKNLIGDRAKLIVGTGNNNFSTCLENTFMAKEMGADAALVVTPYYNKTTQAGIIKYYEMLAKVKLPLFAYNVPSRTGLCIELETIEKMINTNEYFYGIKESTCDINRIIKLHEICKNKVAIYSGEDDLNYVFYTLGSRGCISVAANICSDRVAKVYNDIQNGNLQSALETQSELSPLNKYLFCETNPIPAKFVLQKLGKIRSAEVRPPLVPLSRKFQNQFVEIKEKTSLEKF